jgi:hypothetical protein
MPRPNAGYEVAALASGCFRIDPDGYVWRVRRRGKACSPYRADAVGSDGYRGVYVTVGHRRRRVLAHRLVWVSQKGPIPDGFVVRHWNRDRGDNRPENLYLARPSGQLGMATRGRARPPLAP